MKRLAWWTIIMLLPALLPAQDSILHRLILIGDAGELDSRQKQVLSQAASYSLPGKTSTVFLGDNIYKRGIGLPGSPEQESTEAILRSQFQPFRQAGSRVWFIPGNHDWDRMGKQGLAKIKRQWQFLQEQGDSLLQLLPPDGCPDPIAILLADSLVLITMDSEWWLFPFPKYNPGADCACTSREEVIAALEQIYFEHRGKMIVLATHHPFASYGTHGGRFTLRDHIFPLTHLNKKLKIPLPVVGSLYPLLRTTFTNPEDLGHPLYRDMVKRVLQAFEGSPNLLLVSGHEHGLQYIEHPKKDLKQVVSGSGAKLNHTVKGKYSQYGKAAPGFVIADWLSASVLRLHYHAFQDGGWSRVFTKEINLQPSLPGPAALLATISGDSAGVRLRPAYNEVSRWKRRMLGENYRREFATKVQLPVLKLSELEGGLRPVKKGGGMQTVSLRLEDAKGKEWVLRNIEKNPDPLLPSTLRETFARDLLDDYMSAQHPFAPLIVPSLARATDVPHANPRIGIVAPDTLLGKYARLFEGRIALLEEREPLGNSDNSPKMLEELLEDNDNSYNARTYLRARMLDLLLGDWDRHADQWRWADTQKGKGKYYEPVPRDRDQALFVRQGLLPKLASRSWILPTLQGFDEEISKVKYALFKSGFLNAMMQEQWPQANWEAEVNDFVNGITDTVIDSAFRQLPSEIYAIRGAAQAATMKKRRDALPEAMRSYYRFVNRIVDIRATQKHEFVQISSDEKGDIQVLVRKINKEGELRDTLVYKNYDHNLTKEIRVYLEAGNDSVVVNNHHSRIRVRLIGGTGRKTYQLERSHKKLRLYDLISSAIINGDPGAARIRLGKDTSITRFVPVNLYHVTMPLITAGYNLDDGFIFGAGFQHTHQGFRKEPFASRHQFTAAHSFSTRAYRIRYRGIWTDVWKKADLYLNIQAKAPDNTQNYFGRGNETVYEKKTESIRFYRTRFAIYQVDAGWKWNNEKGLQFSTGPSLQWYRYDADENEGRFIEGQGRVGSYDSLTVDKAKWHAGWTADLVLDQRNHPLLPNWGSYLNLNLRAYHAISTYARSYGQVNMAIALYRSLNARRTIILANRIGAGFTIGHAAFYQSQFLGGHENLQGFRQYRFAGDHLLWNNLELRIKLADWGGYVLPGQFGFTGFYDLGRVWQRGESSRSWHQGVGGGFYYAPAQMALFQLVAGYSREGWLPYFTVGFRF